MHSSTDNVAEIRAASPSLMRPGGGEYQHVVLARVEFAQPRLDVAPDRLEPGYAEGACKLSDATNAAGADPRCRSQRRHQLGAVSLWGTVATRSQREGVSRVLARQGLHRWTDPEGGQPGGLWRCAQPGRQRPPVALPRSP